MTALADGCPRRSERAAARQTTRTPSLGRQRTVMAAGDLAQLGAPVCSPCSSCSCSYGGVGAGGAGAGGGGTGGTPNAAHNTTCRGIGSEWQCGWWCNPAMLACSCSRD